MDKILRIAVDELGLSVITILKIPRIPVAKSPFVKPHIKVINLLVNIMLTSYTPKKVKEPTYEPAVFV
jgi:hypothetical protein